MRRADEARRAPTLVRGNLLIEFGSDAVQTFAVRVRTHAGVDRHRIDAIEESETRVNP